MADQTELTIQSLGKRPPAMVMFWTLLFAFGGALLSFNFDGHWKWAFWIPIWIPFCFFAIPAVHHLSRELIRTKARLTELESRLDSIQKNAEQGAAANP
jgi:hypothetical protein